MIFTGNYGEAGAITELGPVDGLPRRSAGRTPNGSGGPGTAWATTVVAVLPGNASAQKVHSITSLFAHVHVAATIHNVEGVSNQEGGGHVYVRGTRAVVGSVVAVTPPLRLTRPYAEQVPSPRRQPRRPAPTVDTAVHGDRGRPHLAAQRDEYAIWKVVPVTGPITSDVDLLVEAQRLAIAGNQRVTQGSLKCRLSIDGYR